MPDYVIYATLLDKFQQLYDCEKIAEEPWNKTGDDEWIKTPEEIYAQIEVELINIINRCPKEPIEAADRGTAFNEVIDCIILNKPCERNDMTIKSQKTERGISIIRVEYNGFTFDFETSLCKMVANMFPGSIPQYLCHAPISTPRGEVELYGYIDEWCGNKMYDIKTTSMYNFGKYADKWQKDVYPYCVIKSGLATEIASFEYTVVKLTKPTNEIPCISGVVYPEVYTYNHDEATTRLQNILCAFIEWLESKREYITDKRIFGGENPKGYQGTPINNI